MYAVCHYCGKIIEDAEYKVHFSVTEKRQVTIKRRMFNVHLICPYCGMENLSEYLVKHNPKKLYDSVEKKIYRVLPTDDLMKIAVELERDKSHSEKFKEMLMELMRKRD